MAKWKQYELWVQTSENKWEIVGLFPSTELATAVANSRASRARLIEVLYDGSKMLGQEIIAELGKGNRLEFRDFGVFETKIRKARKAQNPKTLAPVAVPEKRTVKFKVGRLMRHKLGDLTGATIDDDAADVADMANQGNDGDEE